MDFFFHQIANRLVHEAMPGEGIKSFKTTCHDRHLVVASAARSTGMARVQMALILNLNGFG